MTGAIESKRVERRGFGGWTCALIIATAISGVLLVFTGCDTTVNAITDGERPTNVSATDGEYPNEIRVTWTAPDPAEDESGDEIAIESYEVFRSTGDDLRGLLEEIDSGATSYIDQSPSLLQGTKYNYWIRVRFDNGDTKWSDSDTGYAITASEISAGSTLSRHVRTYDAADAPASANGKVWFRLLVQRGWDYEIRADDDSSTTGTTVRFLHEKQLEPASGSSDSETGSYTFTADRNGIYFIELEGGSGSVSVRYLGAN